MNKHAWVGLGCEEQREPHLLVCPGVPVWQVVDRFVCYLVYIWIRHRGGMKMPIKGVILIVFIAVIFAVAFPKQIVKWFNKWFENVTSDDDIDNTTNFTEED